MIRFSKAGLQKISKLDRLSLKNKSAQQSKLAPIADNNAKNGNKNFFSSASSNKPPKITPNNTEPPKIAKNEIIENNENNENNENKSVGKSKLANNRVEQVESDGSRVKSTEKPTEKPVEKPTKKAAPDLKKIRLEQISELKKTEIEPKFVEKNQGFALKLCKDFASFLRYVNRMPHGSISTSKMTVHGPKDANQIFFTNKYLCIGGVSGSIKKDWNRWGIPALLLRPEMLKLWKMLNGAKGSTKVVVDGIKGSGKSVAYNYAVMRAVLDRRLVITVPKFHRVTKNPLRIMKAEGREGLYYQRDYCYQFFESLEKTQKLILEDIPLKFDYRSRRNNSESFSDSSNVKNLATENLATEKNLANENLANDNLATENSDEKNLATETLANENLAEKNLATENSANEMSAEEYRRLMEKFEDRTKIVSLQREEEESLKRQTEFLRNVEGENTLGRETGFRNFCERTKKRTGESLLAMVQHGMDREKCPNPAALLYDFLKEANHCESKQVLVAIDNANCLESKTPYLGLNGQPLSMWQLSFYDAFAQYINGMPLRNGAVLIANASDYSWKVPLKKCQELTMPPKYTQKEANRMLEHFSALGVVENKTDENALRIKLVSGRNPKAFSNVAELY